MTGTRVCPPHDWRALDARPSREGGVPVIAWTRQVCRSCGLETDAHLDPGDKIEAAT